MSVPAITTKNEFEWLCTAWQRCSPKARERFINYLKSLPYAVFLEHPYWAVVRRHIYKLRGVACEECYCQFDCEIHHKTYDHHGEEHLYLDDLVILCRYCHESAHGIRKTGRRIPGLLSVGQFIDASDFRARLEQEARRG